MTEWVPPRVISTPFVLLGNVTVPAALLIIGSSIANINVVLAAMPVASYGTLFCIQYQKGEVIMAEGTFLTTLLSVLSIPLLTMFL